MKLTTSDCMSLRATASALGGSVSIASRASPSRCSRPMSIDALREALRTNSPTIRRLGSPGTRQKANEDSQLPALQSTPKAEIWDHGRSPARPSPWSNYPLKPAKISTPSSLTTLLNEITSLRDGRRLYISVEGNCNNELGNHGGAIDILSLLVESSFLGPSRAYKLFQIDIYTLGTAAFTTSSSASADITLKYFLEHPGIGKTFFDARPAIDALWKHHRIRLPQVKSGMEEVQKILSASRPRPSRKAFGDFLAQIQDEHGILQSEDVVFGKTVSEWDKIWKKGDQMVQLGLGHEVDTCNSFKVRPLQKEIVDYCAHNVVFLPLLRQFWKERLPEMIAKEAQALQPKFFRKIEALAQNVPERMPLIRYEAFGNTKTMTAYAAYLNNVQAISTGLERQENASHANTKPGGHRRVSCRKNVFPDGT